MNPSVGSAIFLSIRLFWNTTTQKNRERIRHFFILINTSVDLGKEIGSVGLTMAIGGPVLGESWDLGLL